MTSDMGATTAAVSNGLPHGNVDRGVDRNLFSTVDSYMSERISKVEAILPTLATKADIGEVRADLHKADASTKAWMVATAISLFLGFCGLILTLKSSVQAPLAPSPVGAPTIIQVPAYTQPAYANTPPVPASTKGD